MIKFSRMFNLNKVLICLFSYLVFISPLVRLGFGLEFYAVFFFILVSFVFLLIIRNKIHIQYSLLPLLILIASCFLYSLFFGKDQLNIIFYSFLTLAMFLVSSWIVKQDDKIIIQSALLALTTYYVFLAVSGLRFGFSANDINNYLLGASRNVVSALAIFLQVLYSSLYYRYHGRLPVVTPMLTFVVCFLAYGRTGLALSFVMLVLSLFHGFNLKNNKVKLGFISILAVISFLFLIINFDYFYTTIISNTNFKSGLDTPRSQMLIDYLNFIGLHEYIVGVDLSSIASIAYYNSNPHNSYVYGHANYGFFYILVLLFLFFYLFIKTVFYKDVTVYLLLLFICLARIFLDILTLFGLYDFVVYILIFMLAERTTLKLIWKHRS